MEEMKKPGIMDGAGEWDESKHPRDIDGKFTNVGGGSTNIKEYRQNTWYCDIVKNDTDMLINPLPNEFFTSITEARESNLDEDKWRVDIHNETDYAKDRLFTTLGGSCVAIEPDGNIISVCKNNNVYEKGVAKTLLKKAIEEGGDRLDAFGEKLYGFYTKSGFKPVSWTPFNEDYAPKGWKPEYGYEEVVFYKYTGKQAQYSYQEFLSKVTQNKSYDEARKIRDRSIKK